MTKTQLTYLVLLVMLISAIGTYYRMQQSSLSSCQEQFRAERNEAYAQSRHVEAFILRRHGMYADAAAVDTEAAREIHARIVNKDSSCAEYTTADFSFN